MASTKNTSLLSGWAPPYREEIGDPLRIKCEMRGIIVPTAGSGAEIWAVARLRPHKGKLEEFKRAAVKCQERIRAKDTGTLRYEIYLSADESECVFIEGYRDVDALIEHNANMGELLPAMLGTGSISAELFGHFSDEFKEEWQSDSVRFFSLLS